MSKKTWTIWGTAFLFTVIGTYNSVVIDSQSSLDSSHYTLVKRLDQQGINRPARMLASTAKWQKLRPLAPQKQVAQLTAVAAPSAAAPAVVVVSELEKEDLNLSLVEVINPEKFSNGLADDEFSGMLTTNGAQIETLEISLPQGLGISLSYSEINGNVFEYEMDGQTYSGMLYQVDQHAYMVSFTAGELAGTRLRFQSTQVLEKQAQEQLAQADVGQFGQQGYELEVAADMDRQLQAQGLEASFKF